MEIFKANGLGRNITQSELKLANLQNTLGFDFDILFSAIENCSFFQFNFFVLYFLK